MASKPKDLAAEEIARINPALIFNACPRTTDPAVGAFEHTEFFLQQDARTQNRLMAVRLEAEANVSRAIADGFSMMATALKGDG